MDMIGINARFFFVQLLNCLLPLVWLGLSIAALLGLRNRSLPETARVLWALIILVVPVMGAVAFWIVRPGSESRGVG